MLKFFANAMTRIAGLAHAPATLAGRCAEACADWLRDPMSHPAIAGLDVSAIADLPPAQLRPRVRE